MNKIFFFLPLAFSILCFCYAPTFGLILGSLAFGFLVFAAIRSNTRNRWIFSIVIPFIVFWSLETIALKLQLEMATNSVFDYYYKHKITPAELSQTQTYPFQYLTPSFQDLNYERCCLTDENYKWKLEGRTIWGTTYYYDDKSGDIRKSEHDGNHWNTFLRQI